MQAPSGLNELLELANLDEAGKPPSPSRLSSAAALRAGHEQNLRDDSTLSISRARTQAMCDGEPPYNQLALNSTGQGSRANANFLEGRARINKINNGYLDIITSVKHLMTLSVEWGEPAERFEINRIIAEELTRTIRRWPQWIFNFTNIVDKFNTHGIGVAYWPNTRSFRFSSCGFGDFLIPRQTPASEDAIIIATARKDMTVTELYDMVSNPESAAKMGWNVEAVHAAIRRATTKSDQGNAYEFERTQQEVKSGDLMANRKFQHVPIICGWVREFDGTYTFAMAEKDCAEGDFLCFQPRKYKSSDQAFVFYSYGVGNGTYHGVRGLGHLIYPIIQVLNRSRCTAIDAAMMAGGVMLETESAAAIEDMRITNVGPYWILPKGFNVVENRALPNLSNGIIPVIDSARFVLDQNSEQFYTPNHSTPYQNKENVSAQLEAVSAAASGGVDLFFASHDRVVREMCRRIIAGDPSDELVREFHQRVKARGITKEMLDSVDHASTMAFRAIGAGSPAQRALFIEKMSTLLPQLDDIGRKTVVSVMAGDLLGGVLGDHIAPPPEQPRLPIDSKIAEIENFHLMQGVPVRVNPQELHGAHVNEHVPALMEVLNGIELGDIDPMERLPGLRAMLDHVSAHGEALAQDPTQEATYNAVREAVNNLGQVVDNMERQLKSQQRKAQDGAATGQPGDGSAELAQIKMEQEQFKLQLMQRKGELELAAISAKMNQSLALNDMKAAMQFGMKQQFPRTDAAKRR